MVKKSTFITLCLAALFIFQACRSKPASVEGFSKAQIDSASYAAGIWFGETAKAYGFVGLDISIIYRAIQDVLNNNELEISEDDFGKVLDRFLMKKELIAAEQNLKIAEKFLANNKIQKGVVELPSGLQYKIIEEGTGIQPTSPADSVTVHYIGTLMDGITEFDNSYTRGTPYTTPLDRVILGWTEGFQHFKEGTKALLYIHPNLGYGAEQKSEKLVANSVLIYEIELIKVSKADIEQ
jgi:FKBP-type peptidyl-prolyl cis-trans isomerase FklB